MTKRPLILVAGMGRCGTSLMMQMLAAGGVDCIGKFPDYEHANMTVSGLDQAWLNSLLDCAVKTIDPATVGLRRPSNSVVIWLDRDADEQARSQLKFLRAAGMPVRISRINVRSQASGIRRDRTRQRKPMRPDYGAMLDLRFETLVTASEWSASRVAGFLEPHGYTLDVEAMRLQVRERPPTCLPNMLEEELVLSGALVERSRAHAD